MDNNIDFLIGKEFIHLGSKVGTVTGINGTIVTIKFADKESRFIFPDSFLDSKKLRAADESLECAILDFAGIMADQKLEEKKKADEIKNCECQNASFKAASGFLASTAGRKLSELEEGTEFLNIADVMNNVFGWNYGAYMKGFYYLDNCSKYGAWFPKFSKDNITPGDKTSDWLNIITPDGKFIYMKHSNIDKMNAIGRNYPVHFTFGKKPGESYKYYGAYRCTHVDPELGFVFEKLDF